MKLTEKQKIIFRTAIKVILSLAIVYHLLVMILMPNLASFPGRRFQAWIAPYGNIIGLNASWNFFSPDPAHTMYLKYLVFFEDEQGNEVKEPEEYTIPPQKAEPVRDIREKRYLYAMRFMILDPNRLKNIMGPWLCKQHSGASSISMEHVIETVPPLEEAMTFEKMTLKELSREIQYVNLSVNCRDSLQNVNEEE
ncbi:MAG: hypothetical protein ACLGGX_07550 [Bdellovibrionia bacterium]